MRSKRYGPGPDYKRIYLVAPRHPRNFWSMQGTADIMGAKTLMPNSALATLMALTPAGVSVEYLLADENVSRIDFGTACDLVVVTGATLHAERIVELCARFRGLGRTVALGGTFASIETDRCTDLADHLFVGEAEHTWPEFLRQWTAGEARAVYAQEGYIDMRLSPAPDWALVDAGDYVSLSVQTSRGCPNQCDFCDVIQYVGRRYRTKSVDQVLTELKNAHAAGARSVFFSDDNFLGSKRFTRELLAEVIRWNSQQTRPLSFSTQITVQVADDEELLRMFADARFSVLFLGVETVRTESLDEVHKSQNYDQDPYERIRRISRYGIVPFIGLIVGFDADDETVFAELESFVEQTHSPIVGISLLNAPNHTPLHARMQAEGRLVEEGFGGEWQLHTNIIPRQMSRETLVRSYLELFGRLYAPEAFEERLVTWLEKVDYHTGVYANKKSDLKQMGAGLRAFAHFLFREDPELRRIFVRMLKRTWQIDPKLMKRFFTVMTQYSHFHHFVKAMRADHARTVLNGAATPTR